jgi:hypothetical protein
VVGVRVAQRPRRLAAEDDLVDADHQAAGVEPLRHPRLEVARAVELVVQPRLPESLGIGVELVLRAAGPSAACAASAASMPDLIAAWLPLMREALRKPASSADQAAAGEDELRQDCSPPAAMARAP